MLNWDLRKSLAEKIQAKDAKLAEKILRDRAKSFMELARQRGQDTELYRLFNARAQRLLSASFEIRNLLIIEGNIERQRAAIKAADEDLLRSIEALRLYLTECFDIASALHGAGCDRLRYLPVFPGRHQFTRYRYHTPILYLQSFTLPPGALTVGGGRGRPETYETVESNGLGHWPFVYAIMDGVWQEYLFVSVGHYRKRLVEARNSSSLLGSAELLLDISEKLGELTMPVLDDNVLRHKLQSARKAYAKRRELKHDIKETVECIDAFYDHLAPCEKSSFIGELHSPFDRTPQRSEDIFSAYLTKYWSEKIVDDNRVTYQLF